MGDEWTLRRYDPSSGYDRDGLVYLLQVAYSRSYAGRRAGVSGHLRDEAGIGRKGAKVDPELELRMRAWLETYRPIWLWLLDHADVTLAVDRTNPDRWIWGWLVTSGDDVIHALGVKRDMIRAGVGMEIARDLCGSRWGRKQVLTLELPQFVGQSSGYKGTDIIGRRPFEWYLDPTWLLVHMGVGRAA